MPAAVVSALLAAGSSLTAQTEATRSDWEARLQELRPGMRRREVERSLSGIRPQVPHRTDKPWWDEEGRQHLYALDDAWDLHVRYRPARGVCSPGPVVDPEDEVQRVSLIGFPDLREEVGADLYGAAKLIHDSPAIAGWDFDPVPLIRAVNGLLPLGRDRIAEVARVYDRIATRDLRRRTRYRLDEQKIFLILRLLFARRDGDPQMPRPVIGAPDFWPESLVREWPLFPLGVADDVPFLLTNGYCLAGVPESPLRHLEYCLENCELRDRPLEPASTPAAALDGLLVSDAWGRWPPDSWEDWLTGMLRVQALRSIPDIAPLSEEERCGLIPGGRPHAGRSWDDHLRRIADLGIRWDPDRQAFIPTAPR